MKYFVSIFFLCFCLSCLSAQEKHFVFIQSDNNLPFYVSLKGKLYSSAASGFMIIPKLEDGDYTFSVGFAKNAFPEQGFELVVNKKDLGFNLKNLGEKGWGLFNLQTMNVTMAGSTTPDEVSKAINEKERPKDDFEPLISFDKKSKEALAKTKKAADTPATTDQATIAITNNQPNDPQNKPDNAEANEAKEDNNMSAMTDVKKVSENKDEDGMHLSYADADGKNTDTIDIIIPSVKAPSDTENSISPAETSNADNTAATKPAQFENGDAAKDSLRFLDMNLDKPKNDVVESKPSQNNIAEITNSKCKNIATDEDFTRVRRKMAMQASDEKMINEAKKTYRNKCFTTSQIKKLSTLFLSDEGRYNFITASYNSASDVSEYATLQSEFIDPAFVSRFKAMLQ